MAEDENNSVDLSNLSLEQIKEMYKDIVEFPDELIGSHEIMCDSKGGGRAIW